MENAVFSAMYLVMETLRRHPLLALEFTLLCLVIPGIIIFNTLAPYMFAFLWGATAYGWLIYRLYHFKDRGGWNGFWNWRAVNWPNMKPVLLRWILASLAMLVFTYFYAPDRLFYLPSQRPEVLPWILLVYPVISALPQEFVFCTFFFARYKHFFGTGKLMIAASAICFAYAHCLYINPIAPTLSLLGGLIFAQSYAKHKSLALVTIEHALYGNALFIIGLGWYFYSGAVVTP